MQRKRNTFHVHGRADSNPPYSVPSFQWKRGKQRLRRFNTCQSIRHKLCLKDYDSKMPFLPPLSPFPSFPGTPVFSIGANFVPIDWCQHTCPSLSRIAPAFWTSRETAGSSAMSRLSVQAKGRFWSRLFAADSVSRIPALKRGPWVQCLSRCGLDVGVTWLRLQQGQMAHRSRPRIHRRRCPRRPRGDQVVRRGPCWRHVARRPRRNVQTMQPGLLPRLQEPAHQWRIEGRRL